MRVFNPSVTVAKLQAYDGTTWQNLRVTSSTYPNLRVQLYQDASTAAIFANSVDGRSVTASGLCTASFLYGFDGSNWDRVRTHMLTNDFTTSSTGASSSTDTVTGFDKWTWQITTDASASDATVKLQGSLDNSNWFDLDEWSGTGSTMRHVVNKFVRYVRVNVTNMGDASSINVKVWGGRT